MELNNIAEILELPAGDAVEALKRKDIIVPPWEELKKAYDPREHAVLSKSKYPDIITEANKEEKVTRVVLPFQKLAALRTAELCFATPVARSYTADDDKQKEAAKLIERLYNALRIDALNRTRGRKYFSCCEVATIWHAVEKPTTAYGFNSIVTLRQRTFSPMDGHQIFPLFDAFGDLVALSVQYSSGSAIYLETLTYRERIIYTADGNEWRMESRAPHGLDKIPAVYIYRPAPAWEDMSSNVDEMEFSLSRNGNYLRRNAKPLLAVIHDKEVEEEEEEGVYEKDGDSEFRSIFELPKGSSMQYVTWDGAPESLKFHYQTLRSTFFDSLQLPDWSHSEMKSTPMSGESRKQLYIDAKLKVLDEAGELEVFLLRELSVLRSFASVMRPDLADALMSIVPKVEIQPFEISDEKDTIQNIAQALSAGLISQRDGIAFLNWTSDPDRTLDDIREERKYEASEASY